MRFAFAHKLSTYLMVMCAFLALALSGELGPVAVLLGFSAILTSWLWEPPRIRFERYTIVWTVLSVLVLGYSLLSVLGGGDFLIVGAEFILYLLVAKLFNRRACKDYQQLYVLTFLMLVAGTVLNTEFTYGLFFLGYVIAATWALILFHLRREMEDNFLLKHSEAASERVQVARILNSRRIVGRRFFLGTAAVSMSIFLVASLLFLLIPRIGFGLFFQKSRPSVHMAGFSDGVTLGAHGTIKTDSTVVMRVKVDPEFQGRRAPYIHWRGVAFDRYEQGRWRRSPEAPVTRKTAGLERGSDDEIHYLLYDRHDVDAGERDRRRREGMRQEIYLEPIGYDVLFGASMPMAFQFDGKIGRQKPRRATNDELRYAHSAGIKYVVYSDLEPPPPEVLRAAPTELPEGFATYLQLPDDLPPRITRLAQDITRGARTNYDKAVAIEQWLKQNLGYTLEMRSPGAMEPIEFFLFERKRGHCEYFSSAMAVMSRAVGVPARNVNGFLGGGWNEFDDFIAVRAGDAHSWVEIYFPDVGWVTFDPTPSSDVDQLGRGGDGLGARLARFVDSLRFKWFQWVIEYDLYRQLSLFKSVGEGLRGGADRVKLQMSGARDFLERHKALAVAVVAVPLALIVALALLRRRRLAPLEGAIGKRRRQRAPMGQLYDRVLRRLSKRGYRRRPTATPREHARALLDADAPGAQALVELTEIYYAAEFGNADAEALLPRARELAAAVERALEHQRNAG